MRHWRGVCMWEALATAASVVVLLWVTRAYIEHPQSFHILESQKLMCSSNTSRPCIRKCCPHAQELQQPNPNLTSGCYPTSVSHFSLSDIPQDNGSDWSNGTFDIVYENCAYEKSNPEKEGDSVLLLADGDVKINEDVYSLSDYCVDFKKDKTYVFVCTGDGEKVEECFVLGSVFSASCLLLTIVVYVAISANPVVQQRLQINSIHLSVLLNYLPTLFIAYVLLSVIYENPFNLNIDHPNACRSVGILYPEGHHFSVNGTLRGCICSLTPCIRKCCERNEHYVARRTCGVNTDVDMSNFSLTVYTEHGVVVEVPVTEFAVLYGTVCYNGMFPLDPSSPQDRHYLLEDGRVLRFKSEHEKVYLDSTKYCLDSIKGSSVVRTFVCVAPIEDRDTKISFAIYPIMLSISTLFLLLTFLVYCAIPKLRNSQGKCQMCYISFLFVAYVGLTVSNLKVAVGVWCVACVLMDVVLAFAGLWCITANLISWQARMTRKDLGPIK